MAKIRRIDWSPSEWLAGTRGLTIDETAVYITVLNVIYDRASACPNDVEFIAGQFKKQRPHRKADGNKTTEWRTALALADLVALGKLHVSPDGQWLTNDRAEVELNRARERIGGTVRAGIASGRSRRAKSPGGAPVEPPRSPASTPEFNNINGLTRTGVRIINHHYESESLSKISTGAVRDPARGAGAPGRAHTGTTKERVAALAVIARAKLLRGV